MNDQQWHAVEQDSRNGVGFIEYWQTFRFNDGTPPIVLSPYARGDAIIEAKIAQCKSDHPERLYRVKPVEYGYVQKVVMAVFARHDWVASLRALGYFVPARFAVGIDESGRVRLDDLDALTDNQLNIIRSAIDSGTTVPLDKSAWVSH